MSFLLDYDVLIIPKFWRTSRQNFLEKQKDGCTHVILVSKAFFHIKLYLSSGAKCIEIASGSDKKWKNYNNINRAYRLKKCPFPKVFSHKNLVVFQWMSTCLKIVLHSCIRAMDLLSFLVRRMPIMPSKWWTWLKCMANQSELTRYAWEIQDFNQCFLFLIFM